MLDDLRVYAVLASASVREQMQYRVSFALRTVVDFLVIIVDFAPVYLLARHFGVFDGWRFAELALLYGMVSLSWGLVELGFSGFNTFGQDLIDGEMDRWLLRPRPVLLQITSRQLTLRRLGRILQALSVLAYAWWALALSPGPLVWVAVGVAGGTLFFAGVVLLGAAVQFWTLGQSAELQNMLTYGGSAALSYPISVYARWFRRAITFGVPLAFVNYFPALAVLGRTEAAGWPVWLPALSPLVCLIVLLGGRLLFAAGLTRYESTGS